MIILYIAYPYTNPLQYVTTYCLLIQYVTCYLIILLITTKPPRDPTTHQVVLLSEVLKLNELVCVDLLLAGEEHLPRFPCLTRGLLAVLLYYDGKRGYVFLNQQFGTRKIEYTINNNTC